MANIIIVQNSASEQQMNNARSAIPSAMSDTLTVIAATQPSGMSQEQQFLSTSKYSTVSCIQIACERATEETILILDAKANITPSLIENMLSSMKRQQAGLIYAPIDTGTETLQIADSNVENLISLFGSESSMPFACVAVKRQILNQIEFDGESSNEVILQALIKASNIGEMISASSMQLVATVESAREMGSIPNAGQARCLKALLATCNIEDVFPHHAWSAHREESAAASYHTLAALFIRLGDTNSALECLSLGDEFEDSPRSLALKGIIALERGETLAAVANMVSSLQQYESRKKQNSQHYVHFAPRDIDQISSNLNAGLEALNNKDNETAVGHFAKAVFNFDPFYSELGVTGLKSAH